MFCSLIWIFFDTPSSFRYSLSLHIIIKNNAGGLFGRSELWEGDVEGVKKISGETNKAGRS